MERLTIKELVPYLPYKLQWKFEGSDEVHEVMGIDITDFGVHLFSPYGDYGKCRINEGKPLLRPLSSLTKEIEHNGESFVPMVELYKIARGRYKDSIVKYWSIMSTTSIMIEQEGYSNFIFSIVNSDIDIRLEYGLNFQLHSTDLFNENPKTVMVQCWNILFYKLHEWHFDTKGLLERQLALPIDGKEVECE